jgi:hypothetical protein
MTPPIALIHGRWTTPHGGGGKDGPVADHALDRAMARAAVHVLW